MFNSNARKHATQRGLARAFVPFIGRSRRPVILL